MSPAEALAERRQAESDALIEPIRPKSRALSTIAGYFNVVAVLNAASWIAIFALAYAGPARFAALQAISPWRAIGVVATVAMQLRVGQLLHRRSREGGVWAIAALAPSLINNLMRHGTPGSLFSLAVSLVGLGLVALVWKELE